MAATCSANYTVIVLLCLQSYLSIQGFLHFVHLTLQSSQRTTMAVPLRNLSELELSDADSKKITLLAEAPDLTKLEFTIKKLVVKRGIWEWYSQPNYGGNPNIVNPNSGPQFCTTSSSSSSVQSVRPLMGQIILYEHSNYGGNSLVLSESAPDLRAYGWNDKTSSVRVISGKWSLYHDVGYKKISDTYTGTESISAMASANDAISSVKFIEP